MLVFRLKCQFSQECSKKRQHHKITSEDGAKTKKELKPAHATSSTRIDDRQGPGRAPHRYGQIPLALEVCLAVMVAILVPTKSEFPF